MIEKLTDMELKRKLLESRNINLAEALVKARASEAVRQQMKFMASKRETLSSKRKNIGRRPW